MPNGKKRAEWPRLKATLRFVEGASNALEASYWVVLLIAAIVGGVVFAIRSCHW